MLGIMKKARAFKSWRVMLGIPYSHSSQRANIRCSHYTKLRMYSHSAAGADLSTLTAILSNESHTECAHTEDPCSCSLSGYWSLSSLQPNSCSIHAHVWRNIRSHYSHAQARVRMSLNETNVRILNYSLTPLVRTEGGRGVKRHAYANVLLS